MTGMTRNGELSALPSLNAPFGARCFMTSGMKKASTFARLGLNAPFGARCFMTFIGYKVGRAVERVLMHGLVLGAL